MTTRDRFTWTGGRPAWVVIAGNTYWHYPEHAESLRAWLAGKEDALMQRLIDTLLALHPSVRYAAVYRDGALASATKPDIADASSSESDTYEELLVNPAILTLATQRGNIDCGGLEFVLIRYGNFYQFVAPHPGGHVSVAIEPAADPVPVVEMILTQLRADLA